MGTNVRLPKIHKILTEVDLESSRSPAKSKSWNNPDQQCDFSHDNIVGNRLCDESMRLHDLNVGHKLLSIL